MDPLLFAVNGDVVVEVLTMIVLLSILLERALAVVFEWRPVLHRIDEKGVKEPVAVLVALAVVAIYKFDALAVLFAEESNSYFGYFVTAAIIGGGSKGSIALFKNWLGFQSNAAAELAVIKKKQKEAKITDA